MASVEGVQSSGVEDQLRNAQPGTSGPQHNAGYYMKNGETARVDFYSVDINDRDGGRGGCERRMVDITRDKPIKVAVRVVVPVRDHPKFNFVGKLLGPKGNSLKRLQEDTMCKMAVLGRGSMKDRQKEEELRTSGDPKFSHLSEDLHVEISAFATPAEAHARIAYALAEVRRFLVPDYNDDIRQEQMWEMQILSTQRQHMTPPDSSQSGSEETLPLLSGERGTPATSAAAAAHAAAAAAAAAAATHLSHQQQQPVQPVHVQTMANGHDAAAAVGIVTIDQDTMTPLHHQTMVANQQQQMAAHGVIVASAPHAHVLAQNGGQAHLIGGPADAVVAGGALHPALRGLKPSTLHAVPSGE
ncbi:uncharacterized protein LOC143909282 isoform X2 [Arctopsyche grandis]|uniref:uncharacterized protein LOC143909282 isoform X2 n=1 Tax=Arctopsyche grandis TaxID=121162 RepID=UPI00406DA14E